MKTNIFALVIVIFWICVTLLLHFSTISYNPLLRESRDNKLSKFIPQGWSFFTRDPREERLLVYIQQDNKWEKFLKPTGDPSHFFGIKRDARFIGKDISLISASLKETNWTELESFDPATDIELISSKFEADTVNGTGIGVQITGELIIVSQKPKPWAWNNLDHFFMPAKAVKVYVKP